MSKRNALYRKAKQLLEKDGISENKATEVAYDSLIEVRRGDRKKHGHPGGQPDVPPVAIVEDICLGSLPDCTGESINPFRRIDGTCNNVGGNTKERLELRRGGRGGGGSKG